MTIAEIQQEILRMKKEQDVCIPNMLIKVRNSGSSRLYGRFLRTERTGIQKQMQRRDHVRCAFYGRDL